jgi:ABC-type branched-subunit amino acid transport system substrate-binding protein
MSDGAKTQRSTTTRVIIATWHFISRNLLSQVLSAILSIIVIARITNWWTGPQAYKVYVVGSFNPSEETTQEVWQGFTESAAPLGSIDGINVVADRANDAGDAKQAAKTATELSSRNDVLMVLGHILSTQSQAALPAYLHTNPPVPVILATETNPEVLPKNSPDEPPYPVFRLSPTDDKQATKAADFAVESLTSNTFWIVRDTQNHIYSDYLAVAFHKQIDCAGKRVVMTGSTDEPPNPEELRKANIDCVFFAGAEAQAMTLIDQIASIPWTKKPRIILSDWSVGPNLIHKKGKAAEGIFFTHPLSADIYNKQQYVWYGRQAREIVEYLIRDADARFARALAEKQPISFSLRRFLNAHRVDDARTAIGVIMNERHTFETSGKTIFKFDHDGKSTTEFHVWQIQKQKFVECEEDKQNCK